MADPLGGCDWQPKVRLSPFALTPRTPRAVAIVRSVVAVLSMGATLSLAAPAAACPNCAVGRQARNEVWSDDFGRNMVVALLPFIVIGAICVRADRVGRARSKVPPHAASATSLEPDSEPLTLRRSES